MIYLVFANRDFEVYRSQLNQLRGIPEDGLNGRYANDGERTDGQGKTLNAVMPEYHPTDPTKWKIAKFDWLPQNILDDNQVYGYELEDTTENLINDGWRNNTP